MGNVTYLKAVSLFKRIWLFLYLSVHLLDKFHLISGFKIKQLSRGALPIIVFWHLDHGHISVCERLLS